MSQELDTPHCAISSLYITTLETPSHTFFKAFPFFCPNIATAESTHSHVRACVFSHEDQKKKIYKNNKTIKELSVIQLIKNSFNWHNVWPRWQVQPQCVTSPGQDLALINGGPCLLWRWRNRDRSASAVMLNTQCWAAPRTHVCPHADLSSVTRQALQVTASGPGYMSHDV